MDNPHDTRNYLGKQAERSEELHSLRQLVKIQSWAVFILAVIACILFFILLSPRAAGAQTIDAKYQQAQAYILSVNPCAKDSALAAKYLVDASHEAQLGWGWRLLAAISRYETGEKFNVKARGKAGERGLLQVHPIHRQAVKDAGLDYNDPFDCVLYGAVMLAISERKGYNLHRALEPWSVRELAIKEYRRIR